VPGGGVRGRLGLMAVWTRGQGLRDGPACVRLYGLAQCRARCCSVPPTKGISDIDELVEAFGAGEDANLTLFNHVTEARAAGGGGGGGAALRPPGALCLLAALANAPRPHGPPSSVQLSEEVDKLEASISAAKQEIGTCTTRVRARPAGTRGRPGKQLGTRGLETRELTPPILLGPSRDNCRHAPAPAPPPDRHVRGGVRGGRVVRRRPPAAPPRARRIVPGQAAGGQRHAGGAQEPGAAAVCAHRVSPGRAGVAAARLRSSLPGKTLSQSHTRARVPAGATRRRCARWWAATAS
jgi:hypothetical protein